MARATKYRDEFARLARWMARDGASCEQIAKELGVSPQTISRWRKQHPEFDRGIRQGRDYVDDLVADALLKRALNSLRRWRIA